MTTFNMWHDEDLTFHTQMGLYFSRCYPNKNLSLHEILAITSDAAIQDYKQRGMSRQYLVDKGFTTLVSRVSLHFYRMPVEDEQIIISTWEEKPEPFQLVRAYEITAQDGTKIMSGLSTWILAEPSEHKIIPTKNFTLRPEPTVQKQVGCQKPSRIKTPADITLLDTRTIHYSDLDSYGHTNNSKYAQLVMDSLPEEYRGKNFTDFKINYSREVKLGQKVDIYANFDNEAKKITVIGKIPEGTSFESELIFDN